MNILKLQAFQFKISLDGSKPSIWRRIQVPSNYTFWDLHVAIQDSMGWHDYHLHNFFIRDPKSNESIEIGIADDEFIAKGDILEDHKVKLIDYFIEEKTKAKYIYDFGDSWEHTIVLEKKLELEVGEKLPKCISGRRACPPEDCGGIPGYYHLLSVIANPKADDYEETIEWLGEEFDPDQFDPNYVNFDKPKERFLELE